MGRQIYENVSSRRITIFIEGTKRDYYPFAVPVKEGDTIYLGDDSKWLVTDVLDFPETNAQHIAIERA